jgi:energy-coupling factor transporter ATP-binding protein EcfA2
MGERLRRLTIEAFRGVPARWEIAWPRGESMVIWGPNGSGKSTVADALEWFYGGRIDFLAREGRERALRNQAAARTVPTRVTVETDGHTGGTREGPTPASSGPWGERRVPDSIVLRGRTLSDFVEKPKADKFRTLATILGLADVDQLRMDLQTVRNQLADAREERVADLRAASVPLRDATRVADPDRLLATIAASCARAGIAAPPSLAEALDPGWLQSQVGGELPSDVTAAAGLRADVGAATALEVSLAGAEAWNAHLAAGSAADPFRLRFVQAADAFVAGREDDGHCPLCGQPVGAQALGARIAALLDELRSAAAARAEAERALRRSAAAVRTHGDRLASLHARATDLGLAVDPVPMLASDLADHEGANLPIDLAEIQGHLDRSRAWLGGLDEAVAALPASRPTALPLVELATQIEQARRWLAARTAARAAGEAATIAERLFVACQEAENTQYRAILARISMRVAQLYGALHPGEGLSGVAIEPWTDKGIELVVEFHGARQRPPHGVLSESHLNSLAVALFLAMAELFNDHLDTIVLDDVVNSFDVDHRGRLAELLVTEFAGRQVIVLTHDVQFRTRLVRLAPAWLQLDLTSWTFDEGPREARYATGPLLAGAQGALADGDISGAAQKARRALEELLDEACEAMAAALPFRRGHHNDRRELVELLSGLRGRTRSLSRAWAAELSPLFTGLEADVQAALNPEVHAGRGSASRTEVEAALGRVAELDAGFTCSLCQSRIWQAGSTDAGRCRCGERVFPPATGRA